MSCGVGWQLQLSFDPSLGTSICKGAALKRTKDKKRIFFDVIMLNFDDDDDDKSNTEDFFFPQSYSS